MSKVVASALPLTPVGHGQRAYAIHLRDLKVAMVVAAGAAGSGKTLLAVDAAVDHLEASAVRRIVLARPAVTAGEELGFLPGTVEDKLRPWMVPLYDALEKRYSPGKVRAMMENGKLEICPVAYMRGRTFEDSFVVVDEVQNATEVQFRMIVTRLGAGSKLVLTGDPSQIDLRIGVRSGLVDFLERHSRRTMVPVDSKIRVVHLESGDCMRHPVVREMLNMYD